MMFMMMMWWWYNNDYEDDHNNYYHDEDAYVKAHPWLCGGLISPTGIDEGKKRGLHDFTKFTFVLVRICYQRDCGQNELNNLEGNRKDWSTQLALIERPKRAEKYIITTNNKFWTILPVTLRGYIEEIPKRVSPFNTTTVSYTVWRGTFPPLNNVLADGGSPPPPLFGKSATMAPRNYQPQGQGLKIVFLP